MRARVTKWFPPFNPGDIIHVFPPGKEKPVDKEYYCEIGFREGRDFSCIIPKNHAVIECFKEYSKDCD